MGRQRWFVSGNIENSEFQVLEMKTINEVKIRPILKNEYCLLEDFLYEAIFIPPGTSKPSKAIISKPELQVYLTDFGSKKDDTCLIAEIDNKLVGAVWTRIMNDYGHIDNNTPSLAISLLENYRGMGIGTQLMKKILRILKERGYKQVSLSVQKANYAVKMYEKLDFKRLFENDQEYIMLRHL